MCHADVCVCANRWSRCTLYVTLMVVCVCADCGLFLHDWAHQQVSVLALAFSGFLPVCIYPCMHTQVWIYTSMYVSIYAHVCVYIYIHAYMGAHTHTCIYMHTSHDICACAHTCMHTHTHVQAGTHIDVYACILLFPYIQMCTHTHTQQ